jgi:ParB family chromosome partitioning protein
MLENPHDNGENDTCAEIQHKLKSRDIVAQEYGLKRDTVARYLRVNKLISKLKSLLDEGNIVLSSAVTLSFLKESEQEDVADCMECNSLSVDMKKADILRQFSEKGKLNGENVYKILAGETTPKPNRTPTVKIDKTVYSKYFKPNQPAKEVQETVEKALELYFEQE